jgi:hypothetical protein
MTVGARIYYGDGRMVTVDTPQEWAEADAEDVQVILVFSDQTYPCWQDDQQLTLNYRDELLLSDYYWYSPTLGYGSSQQNDAPADAVIKHGAWSERFREIYNRSLQDRQWR